MITEAMIDEADLVLVMEKAHLHYVERLSSLASRKTFLLKEFGRGQIDKDAEVPDPIGFDLDFYRMCGETLRSEIDRILPLILEMAKYNNPDEA